ncbi:MAG: DUF411 domain-containing protein [Chloroflexota bacterium]
MHILPRAGWSALLLALLLASCAQPGAAPSRNPGTPDDELVLTKSPTCTCCSGHEAYLRDAGMRVRVVLAENIADMKDEYGIPADMRSCHTSVIAGYFVEGHVPLAAIEQLLRERPDLDGIALPGMPAGAPGMGGVLAGPLTVYGIKDGRVVGEFGDF